MNDAFFISREELAAIFTPRAMRQFEDMQQTVAASDEALTANVDATEKLLDATFITLSANAELPNERVLSLGEGLGFDLTDGGVTIRITSAPIVDGGFSVRFVAGGDTELALPLTGILATRTNNEVLENKTLAAPLLSTLLSAVDDAAAATAGVPVGGVYRDGSNLKVRVA